MNISNLKEKLKELNVGKLYLQNEQLIFKLPKNVLLDVAISLRDQFGFDLLIDICGVDYAKYSFVNWKERSQNEGFSRSKSDQMVAHNNDPLSINDNKRFCVVYQLLSIGQNLRLRLKVPVDQEDSSQIISLKSVVGVWQSANWFEREVFDMFGIVFEDHPDLRRILTDYNFQDHPLRKDFPLEGKVEISYDDDLQRVIYRPVSIQARENHPRVIRKR